MRWTLGWRPLRPKPAHSPVRCPSLAAGRGTRPPTRSRSPPLSPGGHWPGLGPPVSRRNWTTAAGVHPATARVVAVQSSPPLPTQQITRVQPDLAELIAVGRVHLVNDTLLSCPTTPAAPAEASSPAMPPGTAGAEAYACCCSATATDTARLRTASCQRERARSASQLASAHHGRLLSTDAGRRSREQCADPRLVGVGLIVPAGYRLGGRWSVKAVKALQTRHRVDVRDLQEPYALGGPSR